MIDRYDGSCGIADKQIPLSFNTWGTMDLHLLLTGIQRKRTGLHLRAGTQWLRYVNSIKNQTKLVHG